MRAKNVTLVLIGVVSLMLSGCSGSSESAASPSEFQSNVTQPDNVDYEEYSDLAVAGYKLGEIPDIPLPRAYGINMAESVSAKVTVETTKDLRSLPGVTVMPVKMENGTYSTFGMSAELFPDGSSRYQSGSELIENNGDGTGTYTDGVVTIVKNADGSGTYKKGLTQLNVNSDGGGTYVSAPYESLTVHSDGSGEYSGLTSSLKTSPSGSEYRGLQQKTITLNGDGSGKYVDLKVTIVNDGNGKATVTDNRSYGSRKVTVDADPLPKWKKMDLLQAVPAIPSVEINAFIITLDAAVLFDTGKYDIRDDAKETLESLAKVIKDGDVKEFEIDGHADSDGDEQSNQVLSENRANATKKYLESLGVAANITAKGFGETQPVASNETAEGKQQNRRIEVIIPVQ
ncbi:MAG: OmpA family protein [Actinomycetaceae bacterium]|nr:OmpA family protein [Actinomycetaceae bacterium]